MMNKGGTQQVGDIKVTMVHADHSCGIQDGDQLVYGGEACGYVIEFENGLKIYHAGDTNVFGDMKIIHVIYAPDIAMLPIGEDLSIEVRRAGGINDSERGIGRFNQILHLAADEGFGKPFQ